MKTLIISTKKPLLPENEYYQLITNFSTIEGAETYYKSALKIIIEQESLKNNISVEDIQKDYYFHIGRLMNYAQNTTESYIYVYIHEDNQESLESLEAVIACQEMQ